MIKFVHKKHISQARQKGKFIIYYSASDIFLGVALMALVVFFIHDYLSHAVGGSEYAPSQSYMMSGIAPYKHTSSRVTPQ